MSSFLLSSLIGVTVNDSLYYRSLSQNLLLYFAITGFNIVHYWFIMYLFLTVFPIDKIIDNSHYLPSR